MGPRNVLSFINKDRWPPYSPNIKTLDYSIWNELTQAIGWHKVNLKSMLINKVKRVMKRIQHEVVSESCTCWTFQLYHMSKNEGDYLLKNIQVH